MHHPNRVRWQAIVVLVVTTLCYCLMEYHSPFRQRTWDGLFFYFGIPLVTMLLLGGKPSKWGFAAGRWRWTLGLTLAGALGAAILLLIAVRIPSLQDYYASLGPPSGRLWPWIGFLAIDIFVWEFFLRSFMLFGLEPALGELAIYVQTIPFAVAHIGKPESETLSSIAGGIIVGYIVRHCRSFWPAFVFHLIIGLVMYTF